MADYTTTNITPAAASAPGITGKAWSMKPTQDFSTVMKLVPYPRTPVPEGSAPRSNVGLVWPRGG